MLSKTTLVSDESLTTIVADMKQAGHFIRAEDQEDPSKLLYTSLRKNDLNFISRLLHKIEPVSAKYLQVLVRIVDGIDDPSIIGAFLDYVSSTEGRSKCPILYEQLPACYSFAVQQNNITFFEKLLELKIGDSEVIKDALTGKDYQVPSSILFTVNRKFWVNQYMRHNVPIQRHFLQSFIDTNNYETLELIFKEYNEETLKNSISLLETTATHPKALAMLLTYIHTHYLSYMRAFHEILATMLTADPLSICISYEEQYASITAATTEALFVAVRSENRATINLLIARPEFIDFNATDTTGNNIIMLFMGNGFLDFGGAFSTFFASPTDLTVRNIAGITIFLINPLKNLGELSSTPFLERYFSKFFAKLNIKLCQQQGVNDLIDLDPTMLSTLIGLRKHQFTNSLFSKIITYVSGHTLGLNLKLADVEEVQIIPWKELPANFPHEEVIHSEQSLTEILSHKKPPELNHLRISWPIAGFFYDIAVALARRGHRYLGDPIPIEKQMETTGLKQLDLPRAKLLLACNRDAASVSVRFQKNKGYLTLDVSLLTCASPTTYNTLRKHGYIHLPSDILANVLSNPPTQEGFLADPPPSQLNEAVIENYKIDMAAQGIPLNTVQQYLDIALEEAAKPTQLNEDDIENYKTAGVEQGITLDKMTEYLGIALNEAEASKRQNFVILLNQLAKINPRQSLINEHTPEAAKFILQNSRLFDAPILLAALAAISNNPSALTTKDWMVFLQAQTKIEHQIVSHFSNVLADNYRPTPAVLPGTNVNASNYVFLGKQWEKAELFKEIIAHIPTANKAENTIRFPTDATMDKIISLKLRMSRLGLTLNWGQKFPITTNSSFFKKNLSLQEHLIKMKDTNPKKFEAICKADTIADFKKALGIHAHWHFSDKTQTTSTKIFSMAKLF